MREKDYHSVTSTKIIWGVYEWVGDNDNICSKN